MSSALDSQLISFGDFEQLREARAIIRHEADALIQLGNRLDLDFCTATHTLYECQGSVIVTGMGKAGLIGQKISATLSSTGTRAHFLHPAEAVHGDLGRLHTDDVLLALSNSGETEEICRLLPRVRQMCVPLVAMTSDRNNTLASRANVTICLGKMREAGPHGLAPSTSTTAMLAMGDALALVVSRMKGFTPRQFATYHPGGSLGRQLVTVGEIMRQADDLRIASENETIREVFVKLSNPGRRTGAVMLVDSEGGLSGIFTDSDLARLLENRRESRLDEPIAGVMTPHPLTTFPEALLIEVVDVLAENKVSELPVVDAERRPVGLIDITDLIGRVPNNRAA